MNRGLSVRFGRLFVFLFAMVVACSASAQTIGGDVFGGCKAANVIHDARVEINSGTMQYVFGGNDESGNVNDSTYVKVHGTAVMDRVFGGHNAYYSSKVLNGVTYTYDHTGFPFPEITTGVIPKTRVELLAGTVRFDVYGAGFAGDVLNSRLIVDGIQIGGADVNGTPTEGRIFGAGCGDINLIGRKVYESDTLRPHCGNVLGTATTVVHDIYSASNCVRIMGGGYSGDARNTNLLVQPTLSSYIPEIYGGCLAGNIVGTATTFIKGNLELDTVAGEVFGGNDYAGWVANTNLTIGQGKYRSAFGGGNGKYDYKSALPSLPAGQRYDTIPGSGKITFTIYDPSADSTKDTRFYGNVYGGGKMAIVGDSTLRSDNASSTKFGQIVMHIHGGYYDKHIFAGGMGLRNDETPKRFFGRKQNSGDNALQLVYGVKVVNVYNCYVQMDIHGGSEFIDDGYPFECTATNSTTLRPSSIMNVLGGHFHHNIYGGGYEGTVYGSVYVNIGREAIKHAAVLNKASYSDLDYAEVFPKHYQPKDISIEGSVYNVSDYGDAASIQVFNTPGVIGGESHIFIDGSKYYTGFSGGNYSKLPTMNIVASIVGSGTSTEGGDCLRQITIRHYGVNVCDEISKSFYSIQRANMVILDSVYVTLTGEKDLFYAYPSPSYTLCRIDTLVLHTDNFLAIENPGIYIGAMRSQYRKAGGTYNNYAYWGNTSNVSLYDLNVHDEIPSCEDSCNFYDAERNQNILRVKKGTYLNIMPFIGDVNGNNVNNSLYGQLDGYCFLVGENNYQAYVFSRRKFDNHNMNDGGFEKYCVSGTGNKEMPYVNADGSSDFRTWKIGATLGTRTREIVIIAQGDENYKTTGGNYYYTDFNSSQVEMQLPPIYNQSRPSHYRITSVSIDPSRDRITLINQAFMPDTIDKNWWQITSSSGNVLNHEINKDTTAINRDPNKTFGLMFYTENGFAQEDYILNAQKSGQGYILSTQDFIADKIANAYLSRKTNGLSPTPTMKFVLTYSKDYRTTTAANVLVTMWEYDEFDNPVAPIDVTITIYTVKDRFLDDELEAVAFYNEGFSDESVRNVVFPITFDRGRTLYLQEVKWTTLKYEDNNDPSTSLFNLQELDSKPTVPALFSVMVNPTEVVAGTPSSVSWTECLSGFNVLSGYSGSSTPSISGIYDLTENGTTKGRKMGVLDGRSIAAVDLVLQYNGMLNYKGDDTVGVVVLKFYYENGKGDNYGTFKVRFRIRTRSRADTIYMASASSITRGGVNIQAHGGSDFDAATPNMGKISSMYVQSFEEAFKVYIPGDVIAVLDTVVITDEVDLSLFEDKTYGNKVIAERVQVIRYSGSDSLFMGKDKQYRGPLLSVKGNGFFKASYLDFNGSATTRVCVQKAPHSFERVKDTLFANAPLIWVQDAASVELLYVNMLNNVNDNATASIYRGGAIGLAATQSGKKPHVRLSHRTNIYNNFVIPTSTCANQGGGVYNDRGDLSVGVLENDIITISNNYIFKNANYKSMIVHDTSGIVPLYALDFITMKDKITRNNVSLTRTPDVSDVVFKDDVTSYITLNTTLGEGTWVGVSKWFPGRNLDRKRDTIFFAVSSNPYAGYARFAYEHGCFFSDTLGIDTAYNVSLGPQLYLHTCAFRMWQGWDSVRFVYSMASARFSREPLAVKFDPEGGVGPFTFSWYNQNTDELLQVERNVTTRESAYFLDANNASNVTTNAKIKTFEYFCMMQASDQLGCDLVQRISVQIAEVDDPDVQYYHDEHNWLGKGHNFEVEVPGIDSNDFRTDNTIKVAKYIRTYRVWHLKLHTNVAPEANAPDQTRGYVYDYSTNALYNDNQDFYPGDIITLYATPSDQNKYSFMFWDCEVTAGDTVRVVMPRHDLTVTAYFGPTPLPPTHWYKAVTTKPDGYTVDYNGHVTISDERGLAWLISTVNGLNHQQARTFIYDTIDIVAGTYDMGIYKWTPLGNTNHPFMGVFRGVKNDGTRAIADPNDVIIKNLFVDEINLPYVGMFGKVDSARISHFRLDGAYIYGTNFAATISASAVNSANIHDVVIRDATVAGTTLIGGVVAQGSNITVSNMTIGEAGHPVTLLGDVIQSGGVIGSATNVNVLNNSGNFNSTFLNALYVGGVVGSADGENITVNEVDAKITSFVVEPTVFQVSEYCKPSKVDIQVTNLGSKKIGYYTVKAELVYTANEQDVVLTTDYHNVILTDSIGYANSNMSRYDRWDEDPNLGAYQFAQEDTNRTMYLKMTVAVPMSNTDSLFLVQKYPISVVKNKMDFSIDVVNAPALKPTNAPIYIATTITNRGTEPINSLTVNIYCYHANNTSGNPVCSTSVNYYNLNLPYGSTKSLSQTFPTFSSGSDGQYWFKVEISAKDSSDPTNISYVRHEKMASCSTEIVEVTDADKATARNALTAVWNSTSKTVTLSGSVLNQGYNPLDEYSLHYQVKTTGGDSLEVIKLGDIHIYTPGVDYGETHYFSRNIAISGQSVPTIIVVELRKINGKDEMTEMSYLQISSGGNNNGNNGPNGSVAPGDSEKDADYVRFLAESQLPANYMKQLFTADGDMFRTRAVRAGGKGKVMGKTRMENNYISLNTGLHTSRVAGLVASAENTVISNNYVYGSLEAGNMASSLIVQMGDSVTLNHCYYLDGTADNVIGNEQIPVKRLVTSFSGNMSNCITEDYIEGVNNLTRLLNIWVREHSHEAPYLTWRSDYSVRNNGYPVFGEPELIKVNDTLLVETCDEYMWENQHLFESGVYEKSYQNEDLFVDSTITLVLTIHNSEVEEVEDSTSLESGYYANGFKISPQMLRKLWGNDPSAEVKVFRFVDSLLTTHGCDSLLILDLSVYKGTAVLPVELVDIKVYPNPTREKVVIEAEGMHHLELLDALGHVLLRTETGSERYTLDMNKYAASTYYVRIITEKGIWVKKVVKK